MKIYDIIKKNLLFLIRSKTSSLILVYGPLLLIILIGVAFNNISMKDIRIGTYSAEYSEFSNSFIKAIEQNTNFKIEKIVNESVCKDLVETNAVQLCIIFPPNMSLKNNISNDVRFLVDSTKVNIVWFIMDRISKTLELKSSQVSIDLTKSLVERIDLTYNTLSKDRIIIKDMRENFTIIKSNANKDYSSLDALDLNFDISEYNLDDMNKSSYDALNNVGFLYNDVIALTNKVNEKSGSISGDADDLISSLSPNSTQANLATSIQTKAIYLRNQSTTKAAMFNSYYTLITTNLQDIKTNNEGMTNKLYLVNVKFESAKLARDTVSNNLKKTEMIIGDSIKNLDNVSGDMDNIVNSINQIEIKSPEVIANPIKTIVEPVLSKITHLNYLLPSLIVIVIMFIAVMISSTLIVVDKNSQAKFRNYISPTDELVFLLSHYLTLLIFILVQMIVIFIILSLAFDINLFKDLPLLMFFVLIISTFFIFLGMIIGAIFSTEETTMTASILINILLLLFSGIILPLEALSEKFIAISKINPFVVCDNILKQFILFDKPMSSYLPDLLLLLGYTILLIIITIAISKFFKRRFYIHFKHS